VAARRRDPACGGAARRAVRQRLRPRRARVRRGFRRVPRGCARPARDRRSVHGRLRRLGRGGSAEPLPPRWDGAVPARLESEWRLRRSLRPGGRLMFRAWSFVAAFMVSALVVGAGTAAAYHTRFVTDNCNSAAPAPTSFITRDGSATVALRARFEGYQWA